MNMTNVSKSVLITMASLVLIASFNPLISAREERGVRTHQIERQGVNPRMAPERDRALRGAATDRAFNRGEIRGAEVGGIGINGGAVDGVNNVDPSLVQPNPPSVNVIVQPPQR